MSGEVIKEGFLKKKGRINPAMQERKVVLSGYTLKYYDFKKLKGEIDVRDAQVSIINEQEFLFQIRATDRIYDLQASTRKDLFDWVETLEKYIPTLPSTGLPAKESKREKFKSLFGASDGTSRASTRTSTRFTNRTTRNPSPERSQRDSPPPRSQSERQQSPPPSRPASIPQEEEKTHPSPVPSPSTTSSKSSPPSETNNSKQASSPQQVPPPSSSPSSSLSSSSSPSPSPSPTPSPSSSSPLSTLSAQPSPRAKASPRPISQRFSNNPSTSPPKGGNSVTRQASAIFSSSKEKEPTLNIKEDYVKKGKLRKKGEVNPIFKERTFVLRHNGQLEYYDDKLVLKGTISLVDRSYLVTSIASFEWKLLPPGSLDQGREYILRAFSQDDMKEWLRALQISMEELSLMKRKRDSVAGLPSMALPSSKAPRTAVLKEGVMFKKGESSATMWRERKFQLFADSILYADLSGKLKGKIELKGSHRVVVMSEESCEFEVIPFNPNARQYSLRAKSKYDMDGWVAKINQCIRELRPPSPSQPPKKNDDTDEDISDNELEYEEAAASSPPSSSSPPVGSGPSKEQIDGGSTASPANKAKKDNPGKGAAESDKAGGAGKGGEVAKEEGFVLQALDEPSPSFQLNELDPDLASEAPHPRPNTWVPDKKYSNCMLCQDEFSFFNRKHHCRNCGKLLCGECTSNFIRLPEQGFVEPVRVCISCIDQQFKHAPKETGGGCIIS